jgi:hypothetical protein
VKQSTLIVIVLCGLLLGGCAKSSSKQVVRTGPPKNDIEFAKETFQLLEEGDEAAAEMLDWEHLKLAGMADVGAMYQKIEGEEARARFRKGFLNGYSNAFKKAAAGRRTCLTGASSRAIPPTRLSRRTTRRGKSC